MNKNKLLMAVAAVALLAGTTGALAQQDPPRTAPAEKSAPNAPAAAKAPAGETHQNAAPGGGAIHDGEADINRKNSAGQRGDRAKSNRVGEGQTGGRTETTGQAPQEREESPRKEPRATEEKKRDGKASEERGSGRDNERGRATTGQGTAPTKGPNANLSATITPENRTHMHEVFIKEPSAPKLDHVAFGLSVGTAVPRSVRIVAIPLTIIEIQPAWRGYQYFMVGDQIVIVDPRTMEIVAVLDA
jgi:hypothetical protein